MSETVHDAARLLKRIKAVFPELTWTDYRYIDEGWDHEVVILDEKIVFRFPCEPDYQSQLTDEVEILRQLKPLVSVRIPDYRYVAPDGSFAGYPIIPGEKLKKEVFDVLEPATQKEIAKQLASLLSNMHTFRPVPDIPFYMKVDQEETKQHAVRFLKSKLSQSDYVLVQEILAEVDEMLDRNLPSVFIHGDVYHSHLYWDRAAERLGVIDFSDMAASDPAFDFAEIHEYGSDFVDEVYAHYTGPKDNTFLERAWVYQRWVGVYMMTDYFITKKISFEESREIFDRTKAQRRR